MSPAVSIGQMKKIMFIEMYYGKVHLNIHDFFHWPILTPGDISSSYTNATAVALLDLFSERVVNVICQIVLSQRLGGGVTGRA